METALESATAHNEDLMCEISELQHKLQSAPAATTPPPQQETLGAQQMDRVTELESTLNAKQAELSAKEAEVEAKKTELEAKQAELDAARSRSQSLETYSQATQQLQSTLQAKESEIEELRQSFSRQLKEAHEAHAKGTRPLAKG